MSNLKFASCLILKCKYTSRKEKLQRRSATASVALDLFTSRLLYSGQTSSRSRKLCRASSGLGGWKCQWSSSSTCWQVVTSSQCERWVCLAFPSTRLRVFFFPQQLLEWLSNKWWEVMGDMMWAVSTTRLWRWFETEKNSDHRCRDVWPGWHETNLFQT